MSGRHVKLEIFSEKENVNKLQYAMESLKRSMKWDEDKFGLEYDLDLYNIVAVNDFNMGAMENKGLNVFNTAYVLADPATAVGRETRLYIINILMLHASPGSNPWNAYTVRYCRLYCIF
jgi:aminopeptidase N